MLDYIIRNALIIDGTLREACEGSVGIEDDAIVCIGDCHGPAHHTVEAEGLAVMPGFIDLHSHTDAFRLTYKSALSRLSQGVTTELSGNCGLPPSPEKHASASDYISSLSGTPLLYNFGLLSAHGQLRMQATGGECTLLSKTALEKMRSQLARDLDSGAFGMSTGLIYPPGSSSTTDELVALATIIGECGGFCASHIRSERDGLCEATEEAVEIGRESKAPVHISHFKACGRKNWQLFDHAMNIVAVATDMGQDATFDVYPYTATQTWLYTLFDDDLTASGIESMKNAVRYDRDKLLRMLAESASHGKIASEGGWGSVIIVGAGYKDGDKLRGKSLDVAAERLGVSPEELFLDIMNQGGLSGEMVHHVLCEDNLVKAVVDPRCMVASDSSAQEAGKNQHPRAWGTFPRFVSRYALGQKLLTISEAVNKITLLPARRMGLHDRGSVEVGKKADLVICDLGNVADMADYTSPTQQARGIEYVFVNGRPAYTKGRLTGETSGGLLRS